MENQERSLTEQEILDLIEQDEWMMGVLHTAEKLKLPDFQTSFPDIRCLEKEAASMVVEMKS